MGMLHDVVVKSCDKVIGHWSTAGYEYDASKAEVAGEDKFVGLAIDEDQQEEMTADRLNRWCRQVHGEFGLTTPVADFDDW